VEHGAFVSPYAYEWFIEGETSANQGRHDEAAMAFENATAAPADDALLMTRLAEEYELSGDSRRADRTLAAARRSHPDSPWVALARGRIAQHRDEEHEAIAAFIRVQEIAPSWDAPVLALAETLVASGRPERASALLLEFLRSGQPPGSERARRALLELALNRGDAETLSLAIALDPHSTSAARAREAGKLALERGQPAFAARALAAVLTDPENVALWLKALFSSGERAEVATFLGNRNGQRLGDWSERVDLLLKIGDVESALDVLNLVTPSPKVAYARGRALLIAGDYAAAAAALAEVPFGSGSFEAARLALAVCSTVQGRPGAAAEALSQAPHGSLAVRETLAGIYLEEGALRAGLRLFDPKRDLERAALATLFERAGHFEEAAAYYAAINQVDGLGDMGLGARVRAEKLASRGHLRAAIAVLDRWTVAAPDDFYARVRLVELLAEDAQVEVAHERGRRALDVIDEPQLRAHLVAVLERDASPE
jgi:thioredoxin-like negative regulator of GroEL